MRRCVVCGQSIDGRRANTVTCSDKCRTALWRARQDRALANGNTDATKRSVTVREPLVTLRAVQVERGDLLEPLCPDPRRCEHRHRHASGPWTCEFNHSRDGERLRVVPDRRDPREAA
jgi:hypothetical protein